jgi:NhaP-type Na+/H+ or K+/H+ antiporter
LSAARRRGEDRREQIVATPVGRFTVVGFNLQVVGARFDRGTQSVGPRGLASIVLGLIVVEETPLLTGRDQIELVVALTVLFSVLLHGVTAAPLSALYAGRAEGMAADAPEKQGTVELPTRVGSVPTTES